MIPIVINLYTGVIKYFKETEKNQCFSPGNLVKYSVVMLI